MEIAVPSYQFFDRSSERERERRLLRDRADAPKREHRLFCARCRHLITAQDHGIAVNGRHAHDFTNPHGIEFHIACFREAPGCAEFGTATIEHTWFPGYAWRIADCAKCDTHLGWSFTSSADRFYGLIIARLTTDATN